MARIYGGMTNSRGKVVTASDPDWSHVRGWEAGVKVIPGIEDGRDTFSVYMTSGSNATRLDVLLGTVTDTPDGPVWKPVKEDK